MLATKKNIQKANPTISGFSQVTDSLGYETITDFLADNPGAIETIYDWLCDGGLMRDGTQIPEDIEEEEEEEEEE